MDAKIQRLERDAAQGDVQAEGKLLLERLRAGELTLEKLRLAAYLGHEASVGVLGRVRPGESVVAWAKNYFSPDARDVLWPKEQVTEMLALVLGLREFDRESTARVAIAIARRTVALETPASDCAEALRAAEEWALDPSLELATAARQAAIGAYGSESSTAVRVACQSAARAPISWPWRAAKLAAEAASHACYEEIEHAPSPPRAVLSAIRQELIPWCLGQGDPVAERVAARREQASCS